MTIEIDSIGILNESNRAALVLEISWKTRYVEVQAAASTYETKCVQVQTRSWVTTCP